MPETEPVSARSAPADTGRRRALMTFAALLGFGATGLPPRAAEAVSALEIEMGVRDALFELFALKPRMRELTERAYAVMVIPEILRGGFVLGGAYGEGALAMRGRIESYWSYRASSVGFSAGVARYRQAILFMTRRHFDDFLRENSSMAVIGEAVVLDDGMRVSVETLAQVKHAIVVNYGGRGLIGGASLVSGVYTRIDR